MLLFKLLQVLSKQKNDKRLNANLGTKANRMLVTQTNIESKMMDPPNTTDQSAGLPVLLLISDCRRLSLVESFGTLLAKHLPTSLVNLKDRGSIIS